MQLRLQKPELERFIDELVKAGRFPSAEAVVEDAILRMMREEAFLTPEDLAAIQTADEQAAGGEVVEFSDFAGRMRKKYGVQ